MAELTGSTSGEVEEAVLRALREELGGTPALRLEPYGTLERFTFKAQRIVARG